MNKGEKGNKKPFTVNNIIPKQKRKSKSNSGPERTVRYQEYSGKLLYFKANTETRNNPWKTMYVTWGTLPSNNIPTSGKEFVHQNVSEKKITKKGLQILPLHLGAHCVWKWNNLEQDQRGFQRQTQ